MAFTDQDQIFMARAIKLAKRGRFTARPNPMVGCVLVKDNQIVGEGWHQVYGKAHAEVNALNQAGSKAKGATCYVTLEPCCHQGKTPPCAQALIDAGIKRVISAMRDPNPKVNHGGFTLLNEAGIQTSHGLLEKESRSLNRGFISRFETEKPWVTLKLAMSLDGKTALADGSSKWITGSLARADVQKLRAKQDAILTGIGTFLADDPSLNVRPENAEWWQQLASDQNSTNQNLSVQDCPAQDYLIQNCFVQPRKILLDRHGRASLSSKFFLEMGVSQKDLLKEIWWVKDKQLLKVKDGQIKGESSAPNNLTELLQSLAQKETNNLLIEAGHQLAGAFIKANLVDEIVIYMAPKLMGINAMGLIDLNVDKMSDCPTFALKNVAQFGEDVRLNYMVNKSK